MLIRYGGSVKLESRIRGELLANQRSEITEHLIYRRLSELTKDKHNSKILKEISEDELRHYKIWKSYTKEEAEPDGLKLWWYVLISRVFGITFGLKLMESGEEMAQVTYAEVSKSVRDARKVAEDEEKHEKELLSLIDEERLRYASSIVLGLNDALVELTGMLAGFTLALQKISLVATAGLISGIAASLSMGASSYLSARAEEGEKEPFKAAVYTTIAYLLTVFLLVMPYWILQNVYMALALTVFNAIVVIFVFTFYISVAKGISFKRRFLEMAFISLGVAALSFGIGFVVRVLLNIDV